MSTVIRVENISKQYRLGKVGTGTMMHDINRWWHAVRGKEDPYLKIGEENKRESKGESEYVWALRDINFEVKQGEVLGLIGRNGAGKSTLLKILSRTTVPTTGNIKIKGRVASLLEVGTGFHPELTGRENVFLNGAIMGMSRQEISRKFDEIVDFAGVERYIDTPVKRYSSGMYVRLAFGVAAHLEPEILIVDEVLAVGDADFQKKALGKMKQVSAGEGRTVLFVSHQLDAVRRLCTSGIFMEHGRVKFEGEVNQVIDLYNEFNAGKSSEKKWPEGERPSHDLLELAEAAIVDKDGVAKDNFYIDEPVFIAMRYIVKKDNVRFTHGLNIHNLTGVHVLSSHDVKTAKEVAFFSKGTYEAKAMIPPNLMAEGTFNVSLAFMQYDPYIVLLHEVEVLSFSIIDKMDGNTVRGIYGGYFPGVIRPALSWDLVTI